MSIGIYKITSPSGKVYIGQSWNIEKRWLKYRRLDCKSQRKLYHSLLKYGFENHEFEIVAEFEESLCNQLILDYHEDLFMKMYIKDRFELMNLRGGGSRGKLSEESRRKMSESKKGEKNYLYGKKLSEEIKQKISKKVRQYSKDGEFIKEFDSCVEAAKETDVNYTSICNCSNGRRKSAGGFTWKFSD